MKQIDINGQLYDWVLQNDPASFDRIIHFKKPNSNQSQSIVLPGTITELEVKELIEKELLRIKFKEYLK